MPAQLTPADTTKNSNEDRLPHDRLHKDTLRLSVLIVDDHELVRAGMRRLLEDIGYNIRFTELASGEAALQVVRDDHFDIVFMDLSLPGISGVEAAFSLLRSQRDLAIIVITAVMDVSFTRKLLDTGVRGYLTKNCSPLQMERAIREVLAGQVYVAPDVVKMLGLRSMDQDSEVAIFDRLSARELQIAIQLLQGKRNCQIAVDLNISEKTVSTHRSRAFRKFGIASTAELATIAVRTGMWDQLTAAEQLTDAK